MIDKLNFTAEDDGFRVINRDTWIDITPRGKTDGYIYQKIADDHPALVVVETKNYTPCMNYRQFREVQEKKPWEKIVEGLKAMMQKGIT